MFFLPFIVHIPLIFAICYQIKKKYTTEPLAPFFWTGLAVKLTSGIILGILYTYYFTIGDTFTFQNAANVISSYLYTDPEHFFSILFQNEFDEKFKSLISVWDEPRTMFMAKVIAVLNIFTFSNYWVNSLYFSLFSFSGLWFLGNLVKKHFNLSAIAVAFSFLFFPSFVFWSSGVIKDSFLMGLICFILFLFLQIKISGKVSIKTFLFLAVLFYLAWKTKFYYAAILGAMLLSYLITHYIFERKIRITGWQKFIIFPVVLFIVFSVASLLIPTFSINNLLFIIHYSYVTILREAGNFTFENIRPEVTSYIIHFPEAAFTGLYRPFIWEPAGVLPKLIGLENLLIVVLSAGMLYSFIKKKIKITLWGFTVVIYVVLCAALMAFIAPNWGTLSRYKTGFMPFWILLLTHRNIFFESAVQKVKPWLKFKSKLFP